MSTETYDQPPPTDTEEDDDDDDDGFYPIVCGECGIEFRVPDHWDDARREDGRTFYCPNGHCRVYGESTAEKLRKSQSEAISARSRAEQLEALLETKNPSAWKKWIGGK